MKSLGVISGMGTRAGLFFIQNLISKLDVLVDQDFPEFVLHNNSKVPDRTKAILYNGTSPVKELSRSINTLNNCEVDVIVSTCVTAYYYLEQLRAQSKAEILSPVLLVRDHIKQQYPQVRKVGLLCTSGTLKSEMFHRAFAGSGCELVTLNSEQQEEVFMRSVYMENGLKSARIGTEAYALMQSAANTLIGQGAEVIIGGCSEVQMGLDANQLPVPLIDAMDVLAEGAIHYMQ